mgnify:CR=1 FL=1
MPKARGTSTHDLPGINKQPVSMISKLKEGFLLGTGNSSKLSASQYFWMKDILIYVRIH